LHIIQKNGFRLLLSATVKMVGAYMACLIFKKVKIENGTAATAE